MAVIDRLARVFDLQFPTFTSRKKALEMSVGETIKKQSAHNLLPPEEEEAPRIINHPMISQTRWSEDYIGQRNGDSWLHLHQRSTRMSSYLADMSDS